MMAKKVARAFLEKCACASAVTAAVSLKDSMWWANLGDYKMCDDATNRANGNTANMAGGRDKGMSS